ncbi:phage tail protein [Deinococcus roseus]|uniref:Tail Collar domain-containing protein n=1 Tax=Deinococcus roseus TaxID=392414 RepID=A0ABQ2D3V1_9DEIO|nr:tail fiber protein [Deinococcus roseus]GGJ45036.1 tail Collar domain-containing protein [Deinococcus roseus]
MADPFVAEIRMFPFNFAPTGWAFCDGQLLPISQNTALFSLLGTYYGGDGKSTFALPDMQGNAPVGQGDGPGLSQRFLGESSGVSSVTLISSEMPVHTHSLEGSVEDANINIPTNLTAMARTQNTELYQDTVTPNTNLNPMALSLVGGGLPHNNMQPYLTVNFCIAMQGVFPPRG